MTDDSGAPSPFDPRAMKFYERWLRGRGKSETTIDDYLFVVEKFMAFCKKRGLYAIDEDSVQRWREVMMQDGVGLAPATMYHYLAGLQSFLNAFKIAIKVELPKVPRKIVVPLNEEEVMRLLDMFDRSTVIGKRNYAMVLTLISTGVRVNELVNIRNNDVDFAKAQVVVTHGKGGDERVVCVGAGALQSIEDYMNTRTDTNPMLFVRSDNHEQLSTHYVWHMLHEAAHGAGIEKRITPHILRHTCATLLNERGGDLMTIKEMLGHKSVITTQRYIHVSLAHKSQVSELAPEFYESETAVQNRKRDKKCQDM